MFWSVRRRSRTNCAQPGSNSPAADSAETERCIKTIMMNKRERPNWAISPRERHGRCVIGPSSQRYSYFLNPRGGRSAKFFESPAPSRPLGVEKRPVTASRVGREAIGIPEVPLGYLLQRVAESSAKNKGS